jgi:hypothetical protein
MQIFEAFFKGTSTRFWPLTIEKVAQELYAPQTTISEGGTKDDILIFERFIFCSSFQNLRLGCVIL